MLPLLQAMYSDTLPSSSIIFHIFKNAAQDLLNEFCNSLMGHNTQFETRCPRGLTGILLGFARRTTLQSNQLQKVQAKLILLVQEIPMAELLARQDLWKKLLWATLKLSSPRGHPVSGLEQHPAPSVINIAIKIKGANETFFFLLLTQDTVTYISL